MLIHSGITILGAFLLRKKRAIRSNLAACIRSRPNSAPIPCAAQKPASLPVFELGEVRLALSQRHPCRAKFAPVLLCVALALAACDDPTQDDEFGAGLTDTVYAGEDADGNWVTFAFRSKKELYYFPGTPSPKFAGHLACFEAEYTFKQSSGRGEFSVVNKDTSQDPPVITKEPPIAFSIIDGGLTMTLPQHPGKTFLRVRDENAEDEEPFGYVGTNQGERLAGTVWAGTAYRTKDWTTLTVTDGSDPTAVTIHVTHSFDCSSWPRAYSDYQYNTITALDYVGDFKVQNNFFIFPNFYGHGAQIILKRLR